MRYLLAGTLVLLATTARLSAADEPPKRTPREALQACNVLIGSWDGTGTPEGTRDEKQKGFWMETIRWDWQFKGEDAWLRATIEKGKYYTGAELRYLPDKDLYQLKASTTDKETLTFEGTLQKQLLTLERTDETKQETQRLVVSLLHENRFLYSYEVQPQGKTRFRRLYQVGATKEGTAFATGDGKPECVVSGGLGTIKVTYKGQTFYVCCSGCRDAFQEDPEKYIKEFEERKKQKK